VAGSPAGIKRSPESMRPSLLKSSKPLYLYDEVKKELIYTSDSQTKMGEAIGITKASFEFLYKRKYLILRSVYFFFLLRYTGFL
jgi:hypothetical protein